MSSRTFNSKQRRATFLVVIMVMSVVAMAAVAMPAAAEVSELERTIDETSLEPGESTEITLEATLDGPGDRATISDDFTPDFGEADNVDFQSSFHNDDPVTDPVASLADETFVEVVLEDDFEEGDTITLNYEITIPESAEHGDVFTFDGASGLDDQDPDAEATGPNEITVEVDDPEPDAPADFQLDDLSPEDEEVMEGDDPISYEVWVQNTGDETGEQDIELTIGDEYDETITQELPGGADETVIFDDVPVGDFDPDEYTVEVTSEDDSIETSLTVTEVTDDPNFQLDNLQPADLAVFEGDDPWDYTVEVENVGDDTAEQAIELTIGDDIDRTQTLELTGGEEQTVTFEDIPVGDLAVGDYTVEVSSENDTIDTFLVVDKELEAANFQLSDLEPADDVITEGADPFDYSVEVENIGGETGDQDIDLEIRYDGEVEYSDTVEDVVIDPAETELISFGDVPVDELDPGEYTVDVSSDNHSIDTTLTVEEEPEAANYQLSDLDPDELSIIKDVDDDPANVSVTVENIGDESGDQTIELVVTNETDDEVYSDEVANVKLASDENVTIEFEDVPVDELDVGDYTHTVSSANDSISGEISVIEEEPFLDDELPGFGPVAALIAMLLAAGAIRRFR